MPSTPPDDDAAARRPPAPDKPPAAAEGHGLTIRSRGGLPEPRLPHERDESSDSQALQDPESAAVGRQAAADLERGLVDTSKALETDAAYNGPAGPAAGDRDTHGSTEDGRGGPGGAAAKEGPARQS